MKQIEVRGIVSGPDATEPFDRILGVIISNDEIGRTISITDGDKMFSIPFEPLERYLKPTSKKRWTGRK